MIHILTSTKTILTVNVRAQESRSGDGAVEGVLSLKLKKQLLNDSFEEQQSYLDVAAIASYVSLNKLDQRQRFRASVDFIAQDNVDFSFTKGSSSSGLGYALALFQSWWETVLNKAGKFQYPIFATGEILTSGQINPILHLSEKIDSTCDYIESHRDNIPHFYFCYPKQNDTEMTVTQRKRLESLGGVLIPSERLQYTLGELLGDAYDGDPLGRWKPFKGLESFNYEDSPRYFGRDSELQSFRKSLKESSGIVTITGVSGAGKSSFVKAGLIPSLEKENKLLYCSYTILIDNTVLDSILESIGATWDIELATLKEVYQQSTEELLELVKSKSTISSKSCFICIDQFENIFSQKILIPDSDLNIIDKLSMIIENLDIVLCLDSEYLDEFLIKDIFVSKDIFQLRSEFPSYIWKEILTKQALFSGLTFEVNEQGISLDSVIIEEAILIKQALPVVGRLLELLFSIAEKEKSSILKFEFYKNIGGLTGTVVHLIESVFNRNNLNTALIPLFFESFIDIDKNDNVTLRRINTGHPNLVKLKPLTKDLQEVHLMLSETTSPTKAKYYYLAHPFLLQKLPAILDWKKNEKKYILWVKDVEGDFLKWIAQKNKRYDDVLTEKRSEVVNAFVSGYLEHKNNLVRERHLLSIAQTFRGALLKDNISNDSLQKFVNLSFLKNFRVINRNIISFLILIVLWNFA